MADYDGYDDGYSDGQNDGWQSGLDYIKDEIKQAVKSLESGDMDFEVFVDAMKRLSKRY